MIYTASYASPLGPFTLASDGARLTGLWMDGQKYALATLREPPVPDETLPIFSRTRDWLDRYFAGERPLPRELPLAPDGSAFRQTVWRLLCEIPYGGTTTYGALARQIAALRRVPTAAQAVGGAVGHNPISVIIPCHRVLGADGGLVGYAGGLAAKRRLLQLEGVLPPEPDARESAAGR